MKMKKQILLTELLEEAGSIAVVQTTLPAEAVVIARRLFANGVKAMEIAYRDRENYEGSDECIRAIRDEVPEILVGAATITSSKLARRAINSGAQFILTAGFNPETVKYCVCRDFPIFPGVATPGEIEQAMEFGLYALKLFPVEILGGVKYLKALSGPYADCKFIVTGGINDENVSQYKDCENVLAVSGSFLCR